MAETPSSTPSSPAHDAATAAPHAAPTAHASPVRAKHAAAHPVHRARHKPTAVFTPLHLLLIALIAALVIVNQALSLELSKSVKDGAGLPGTSKVGLGKIVAPKVNPDGRSVQLFEYPTITSNPPKPSSGDAVQDAVNTVIPVGTPFYAQNEAAGATFDDPLSSLTIWPRVEKAVQLDATQTDRWNRLVSQQTCDFCCGGPNSVTIVNRCGCTHAAASRGISKFLVKYHGDQYSDDEILGEARRWQAVWYPKGLVQDHLVFTGAADANSLSQGGSVGIKAQFAGQGGAAVDLSQMPEMVGGC